MSLTNYICSEMCARGWGRGCLMLWYALWYALQSFRVAVLLGA